MKRTTKKWLVGLVIMAFVLSMIPATAFAEDQQSVKITLLATSDIHGRVMNWNYDTATQEDGGFGQISTLVNQVRSENPYTILVDNGDTVQGTPLVTYYNIVDKTTNHPIPAVMNAMGYDAWVIGNHEYNYGLDLQKRVFEQSNTAVLSANTYKEDNTNYVKPYIVKEYAGVKVGILGLTTPNIPNWENAGNYQGLHFGQLVPEGKKWVDVLRNTEKVDVVVVVAHSGVEKSGDTANVENQVRALAEQVPGINVIVAGHSHEDLSGTTINGVTIVEPKNAGTKLSRVDITVANTSDKWQVGEIKSANLDVKGVAVDPKIAEVIKPYHEQTLKYVDTKIGEATGDFAPVDEVKGISDGQVKDTALIDLVNEVQMYYGKADVSLAAQFSATGNVKKGDIRVRDISGLYIYDNTLYTIEITGKQLKAMMEHSAKYYNTYKPGDVTVSFNPDIRGYNYDMFQGVNYDIDISQPAGQRVKNVTFKGQPLADDQVLKLALNNYRFNGGGGFMAAAGITNPKVLFNSEKEMGGDAGQVRSLIISYIKEKGVVDPNTVLNNNWKISGANLDSWVRPVVVSMVNAGVQEIPRTADERTANAAAVNVDEQITRGELYKLVARYINLPKSTATKSRYLDVLPTYVPYVEALADNGYITRPAGTAIGALAPLTRERGIQMIVETLSFKGTADVTVLNKFWDAGMISEDAKQSMALAVSSGIVVGHDGGLYPQAPFTRADALALLTKLQWGKQVTVLSINDFHGALEGAGPWLATDILNLKAKNPAGTLLLSAGDNFQGTPLSNVFYGKPVTEMYSIIGLEATAVGNHEFDWGIEKAIHPGAQYSLLAANIIDKSTGAPAAWAKPYQIFEKNGVKVGVIGFATPETPIVTSAQYSSGYDFKDPVAVANEWVPKVRAAGADLIVLLTHIGDSAPDKPIYNVIKGVQGVDIVMDGHSHSVLAKSVNGVALASSGNNGKNIARVTTTFLANGIHWAKTDVVPMSKSSKPNADVQAIIDKYNTDIKPIFAEVLGKTNTGLTRDYNKESNAGNWMADAMKEAANVDFAFTNAGGIRADLPAGELNVGSVFLVMPFDNTLVTGEMTGAQIKELLEQSVTLYKGMLQLSGLTFTYDSTKPAQQRVVEIKKADGSALDMAAKYKVATNDFLMTGGDGFVTFKAATWTNTQTLVRNILVDAVRKAQVVDPKVEGRIIDLATVQALQPAA